MRVITWDIFQTIQTCVLLRVIKKLPSVAFNTERTHFVVVFGGRSAVWGRSQFARNVYAAQCVGFSVRVCVQRESVVVKRQSEEGVNRAH